MRPWSVLSARNTSPFHNFPVTRCRKHSSLAQNLKLARPDAHLGARSLPAEPISLSRPDPYALLSSELLQLRKNLLNLLGSAHPALNDLAQHYFLHPSKQLRPLLVLLFSQATNGLGDRWEEKKWIAECEHANGRHEELNRPLTRPGVLNDSNPNMPDHTASFEFLFSLQSPKIIPRLPPLPSSSSSHHVPSLMNPPAILPSQFRLAQLVEMIHVASSLHDEVVNKVLYSKSSPSPQDTLGNKLAILGGDFLLGRASTALSRLGDDEVVELVATVISNIVEGTIWRMNNVRTLVSESVSPLLCPKQAWDRYFNSIYLNSASLLAKAARAAVVLGGSRDGEIWKEVAYAYGLHLGFANQLVDDAVDYEADQLDTATSFGPTGPLLYAWEEHSEVVSIISRDFAGSGDAEQVREFVRNSSGVERTRTLARTYAEKAREVLRFLPDSDSKRALTELTDRVVDRTW